MDGRRFPASHADMLPRPLLQRALPLPLYIRRKKLLQGRVEFRDTLALLSQKAAS